MIDSVLAVFPDQELDVGNLTDVQVQGDKEFTARLGTLRVEQRRDEGVKVVGSWPMYAAGNNVDGLSSEALLDALSVFEKESGLDTRLSRVHVLEIGVTLAVSRPPREYLSLWEAYPRSLKDAYASGRTVIFRNKTRSFTGYDKRAKMKNKGLPSRFDGFGALRIEYRQKRNVKSLFGRNVSLRDLAEPEPRSLMLGAWRDNYGKVVKRRVAALSDDLGTPRDFEKMLAAIAAQEIGYERLRYHIDDRARIGGFSRTNASRMRNTVKGLCQDPALGRSHDLTLELDECVHEFLRSAS